MIRTWPALFGILALAGAARGGDLTVKVTGFHNQKGNAIAYLWTAPDGFPSKTEKASVQKSAAIPGDSVTVVFNDVVPGTYAVSITHDENGNGKMDTGFMGKPKEGYGASNNPQNKMSAPSFDQCKFTVDQSGKSIEIALRY